MILLTFSFPQCICKSSDGIEAQALNFLVSAQCLSESDHLCKQVDCRPQPLHQKVVILKAMPSVPQTAFTLIMGIQVSHVETWCLNVTLSLE